jgi:hypothetical protein
MSGHVTRLSARPVSQTDYWLSWLTGTFWLPRSPCRCRPIFIIKIWKIESKEAFQPPALSVAARALLEARSFTVLAWNWSFRLWRILSLAFVCSGLAAPGVALWAWPPRDNFILKPAKAKVKFFMWNLNILCDNPCHYAFYAVTSFFLIK